MTKSKSSGVVLTDHNTGKQYPAASVEAAEKNYEKINEKDAARGFPPNYSVTDESGAMVGSSSFPK